MVYVYGNFRLKNLVLMFFLLDAQQIDPFGYNLAMSFLLNYW